ncbi:MAG: DNA polymerase I [Legionellaceae bacterium]|nr:DNA polymerase I [Legionellaceae bacterium]
MTQALVLIDGSSYFFRAYHAVPPLVTPKGQATGAIYGVVQMINRLRKDYSTPFMAIVFDLKGKTHRHEWYSDYKAHRPSMPQDLQSQFEPLLKLLRYMGLPILSQEGTEADDIIGTLTQQAVVAGKEVIISTMDKDFAQLVSPQVTLVNTMSNTILDEEGVQAKFGVKPAQIIDYLSLIGDTSDNIPGVSKCGPKTAVKWLTQYGSLDQLLLHANEIGGVIGEHLRASVAHLPLSKKLVTIQTQLDFPVCMSDLQWQAADEPALQDLLRELEFHSLLKKSVAPVVEEQVPVKIMTQEADFQRLYRIFLDNKQVAVYPLLEGSHPLDIRFKGIGLATATEAAYLSLTEDASSTASLEQRFSWLRALLENPEIAKITHYAKGLLHACTQAEICLQGQIFDTMLESYLLDSHGDHANLSRLVEKNLTTPSSVPSDPSAYTVLRAQQVWDLHHLLYPKLTPVLQTVLEQIEIPLISVLADMEHIGIRIDPVQLQVQGERLHARIQVLEKEAEQLAGGAFNLQSPKQLQHILFEKLQLPVIEKTPKGDPSTKESTLQELAAFYPLPAVILEHRGLSKLLSTYIESLPKHIHPKSHRVHTSYHQALTATGRLSSSDPNLQNIPIRTEEGRRIRNAFIPQEGYVLVSADYSQIELRIMAHLSQDPSLLKAFASAADIHTATASELFNTPQDAVTSEQRRRAKAINFGLIYGMSAFGLAKQLGIDRQEAQRYINIYFERYPNVLQYMDTTRALARQQGYVETLFGRRLYLPEIRAREVMRQKAAERAAINAPMQGTAADILKKAMITLAQYLKARPDFAMHMLLQVHDELVFEVHASVVEEAVALIHQHMEHACKLDVPLLVSVGVGPNWDAAH